MIEEKENKLLIGFGGDTMIGRGVNEKISREGYRYPWGNMLPIIRSSDVNIFNLETTLTESNAIVPKVFNFKATPDKVQSLLEAGINIVSLANNHILDYDVEGLSETIQVLDEAGIAHVGAGLNFQEASKPTILTKDNITIGVIGCSDNESDWAATNNPGVNFVEVGDRDQILHKIRALKNKVDHVIISYHWGPNMREVPPDDFQSFAHMMIDAGVSIIHGHSAHIFQGIELYNDGVILYDTGDFVDDYEVDPVLRNDLSFYFRIEVDKEKVLSLRLIPILISNMQVNKAEGKDYRWCMSRMKELSKMFGTTMTDTGEVIFSMVVKV